MSIAEVLNNKCIKPKLKVEQLCKGLLDESINVRELLAYAEGAKDSERATCIEALEHATKHKPQVADKSCFQFVCRMLQHTAPRVKWESARVIAIQLIYIKETWKNPLQIC